MNKLSDRKEFLIDKMLCLAYSVRIIAEVVQVSRATVQKRRAPMVYGRGFWFVNCPCGKPVIDPDTDRFHDQEPCARRARRNRLLLRMVRRAPKPKLKLSAIPEQYVSADRPVIPAEKQALRNMLADAVRNTK